MNVTTPPVDVGPSIQPWHPLFQPTAPPVIPLYTAGAHSLTSSPQLKSQQHLCVCIRGGQRPTKRHSSGAIYLLFGVSRCSGTHHRLEWLTGESQGSVCFYFLITGITSHTTTSYLFFFFLKWVTALELMSLCL